jgi:oligopeptide/dipeptide ABC transporter ATP-binding protein
MSVLDLANVSRNFGSAAHPVRALRDVSLAIEKGERLGVVGESGSGKTTLARIALGLTRASTGTVRILDRDVTTHSREDRAFIHRNVQMVFQDPMSSLNPRKRIKDIIALPLRAQGIGNAASRSQRVRALLDSVGLPQRFLDARPGQLSGGQRQRVGIARALAIEPQLLLLDEPTASLDVSVQARVLELLGELQERLGIAQVMISHNLGVIRHAADRVAVMYLGQIVETGSTAQLYDAPAHPYTQALFSAIPRVGDAKRVLGDDHHRARGEVASALNIPSGCPFHPRCPQATEQCRTIEPVMTEVASGQTARCHLVASSGSASA